MNEYKAFYKGKTLELTANSSYEAQVQAGFKFLAKRSSDVSVVLCEVSGKQVIHNASSL